MDLAHPLAALVPSLDSAVLEVLAGSEGGLSASRIARLAPRGTRAGHAHVLERLVAQGLVLADPANQGYLYRLNREHVLAPAVLTAARARTTVLDRLTESVRAIRPVPVHASVFGSFARGEAGADSDIDVLLVAARPADLAEWEDQTRRLETHVLAWTGNRCHVMCFDLERVGKLARSREPIVTNWLEDELRLHGEPLSRLLGAAGSGQTTASEPGRAR